MGRLSGASVLLILVNLGFVVAGVFLIRFTSQLNSTGWLEALNETEYQSAAGTLLTAVMALGVAAIALALIGIAGALMRNRMLLLIYSFMMVAAMIIFGVIGGTAFSFRSKMVAWLEGVYPYDDSEKTFAPKFNEVYCYAQGAYFCNSATTEDLVAIFLPTVPAPVTSMLPQVKGLNSLCAIDGISLVPNSESVCKACDLAKEFAKFEKVLAWADEKCPRTATTAMWCASFLSSGTPGEVFINSPYSECRTPFLTVAADWGTSLMVMGGAAFLAAALLLALSCFARRGRDAYDDDEVVIMDSRHHDKA